MARWKLTTQHYLNVPGIEWEYQELDRKTNRQVRRKFPVPLFLDPRDPADWTEYTAGRDGQREDGFIVVSNGGTKKDTDVIFTGDPSPDMVPLDEEGTKITNSLRHKWDSVHHAPVGDFSQSMLSSLQKQVADVASKQTQTNSTDGMQQFMGMMTEVMKQQADILNKLANPAQVTQVEPASPKAAGTRRA